MRRESCLPAFAANANVSPTAKPVGPPQKRFVIAVLFSQLTTRSMALKPNIIARTMSAPGMIGGLAAGISKLSAGCADPETQNESDHDSDHCCRAQASADPLLSVEVSAAVDAS